MQFYLDPSVSHAEAMRLLDTDPDSKASAATSPKKRDEPSDPNVQTLTIGGDDDDSAGGSASSAGGGQKKVDDAFQQQLVEAGPDGKFPPIRVDAAMLLAMKKEEVFVRPWPAMSGSGGEEKYQYFRYVCGWLYCVVWREVV